MDQTTIFSGKIVLICIAAFTVYIITAVNSSGYHHPDEHYQIIEFAGLKAGWNTGDDLAWEYDAQMRPALQPVVAFTIIRIAGMFGVADPFMLSCLFRMITAALSLLIISAFIQAMLPTIQPENRIALIIVSLFLWFLPAMNVRFSSETFSGLTLLLVITILYPADKRNVAYWWTGIAMGISFEFRYQIIFCLLGIFFWLLCVKKPTAKQIGFLISGGGSVLMLCTFIDSLFYGQWVVAPINYFKVNLLDGVASLFGVTPWHYYLTSILTRPTLLIGIYIFFSLMALCIVDRRNILVWCIIPYIAVHSCIPHKELRFLFPLANLIPVVVIQSWQLIQPYTTIITFKYMVQPLLLLMILMNTGGLIMMAGKPAGAGSANMIRFIQENYPYPKNVYCHIDYSPFTVGTGKGLLARFYCDDGLMIKDIKVPGIYYFSEDTLSLFVIPKGDKSRATLLESLGFAVQKESIPARIEKLNRFYRVYSPNMTFLLYSKQSDLSFQKP